VTVGEPSCFGCFSRRTRPCPQKSWSKTYGSPHGTGSGHDASESHCHSFGELWGRPCSVPLRLLGALRVADSELDSLLFESEWHRAQEALAERKMALATRILQSGMARRRGQAMVDVSAIT
jgi:hypothetical protein